MTTDVKAHKAEIVATPPKYLAGIPIYTGTEGLMERTIERTLAAETPEQLLADPTSGSLRDYTGKAVTITEVLGILPSQYQENSYYIVFEAVDGQSGEIVTLSTGSPYAASRIATLAAKGWLPRRVQAIQLESVSNPGQSSLWIVDAQPRLGADGEPAF